MHRILTICLALLVPALVVGFVALNPPTHNPYDLPETLQPELFSTTSVEVRSEAVVPVAARTRVVVASSDPTVLATTVTALRALGYPSVLTATAPTSGVAVFHRAGFEGEAATIAAALGLSVGSVLLDGTVTDVDDQGDVIVVLG